MFRSMFLAATCCVFAVGPARAGTAISETSVRSAIERFLKAPTVASSKTSMRTILKFAEESDDVSVFISRKATPWVGEKKYRHSEVLLCALIAGNVRSQLDSGVSANDSYSGMLQVFRVYRYIRKRDRSYVVRELDDLIAMHKAGRLMAHLMSDAGRRGKSGK
ncbi:MAG: hypothetical protein ACYTKD_23445 [Planctomycetota bacterium]